MPIHLLLGLALAANEALVDIPGLGKLKGLEADGVRSFKGVPFALPPVKNLRFAPPQPVKAWEEVLDATEFKHNCMQDPSPSFMGWPQPLSTLSEDCLYLNVYAPKNSSSTPVMLWIYGGGYRGGGSNETRLNGTYNVRLMNDAEKHSPESAEAVASEGLVVVTINYRLNVFGFLAAEELRARDKEGSTGNYGIQDQRMAMQWVHEHISAFGGDPSRVYIVGQSAGASSVSNHLVRNKSWPFFSAAGLESGAFYEGPHPNTVQGQRKSYEALLMAAGCSNVDCLADLDAKKLLELDLKHNGGWMPTVDGVDLVAPGMELASSGHLAPVPVIVGSVSEDINPGGTNCEGPHCAESDFLKWAKDSWGFNATEARKLADAYADEVALPGGDYNKWFWAEQHAGADQWAGCPARRLARWVTRAGQRAYFYRWTYSPVGPNGKYPSLAHHACEQPFVFHVLEESEEESKEDHGKYHIAGGAAEVKFSAQLVKLWASMAASGSPGSVDGMAWAEWTEEEGKGLVIAGPGNGNWSMQSKLRAERCDIWDNHLYD